MTTLISIVGWFFIVLILLIVGVYAVARFTVNQTRKGVKKVQDRRKKNQ